ncbi:MAG: hypothetical protein ABIF77_07720 [bacterium]
MRPGFTLTVLTGLLLSSGMATGGDRTDDGAAWSFSLGLGYDSYIHTYPLAEADTTETVTEWNTVLGAEAVYRQPSKHRWRFRPEISFGSELVRERLGFNYQFRPDSTHTVFHLDARWRGRQYRGDTEYSLSSDNHEGKAEGRFIVSPAGRYAADLRLHTAYLHYLAPSILEVNYRERGVAALLRSGADAARRFSLGGRLTGRSYPDSTVIDRTVITGEGDYEAYGDDGSRLRMFHRSDRRLIRDETIKPSAMIHWSELECAVPVGPGWIDGELVSEIWQYDTETSVYFNSWRLDGALSYRGGDILTVSYQIGLALERLDAATDSPEAYSQMGIRGGLESYGHAVSGALTLEYGHRDYGFEAPAYDDFSAELDSYEFAYDYSDFNYWEIWLMANWGLARSLSLDVLANYQPESHTERDDDSSVAFVSLRLLWRW